MSTRVHAGQLEKVREEVPNTTMSSSGQTNAEKLRTFVLESTFECQVDRPNEYRNSQNCELWTCSSDFHACMHVHTSTFEAVPRCLHDQRLR